MLCLSFWSILFWCFCLFICLFICLAILLYFCCFNYKKGVYKQTLPFNVVGECLIKAHHPIFIYLVYFLGVYVTPNEYTLKGIISPFYFVVHCVIHLFILFCSVFCIPLLHYSLCIIVYKCMVYTLFCVVLLYSHMTTHNIINKVIRFVSPLVVTGGQ